jgi:hypothetical protein
MTCQTSPLPVRDRQSGRGPSERDGKARLVQAKPRLAHIYDVGILFVLIAIGGMVVIAPSFFLLRGKRRQLQDLGSLGAIIAFMFWLSISLC